MNLRTVGSQCTRDSIRLEALAKINDKNPVFGFSPIQNTDYDYGQYHINGTLTSGRNIDIELQKCHIETIENVYFDWYRMPKAYRSETIFKEVLFCEILPFIAGKYLQYGSKIWLPAIKEVYDLVDKYKTFLLPFRITTETNLYKNMLYEATAQVVSEPQFETVFANVPSQDDYLVLEGSGKPPAFLCLEMRHPGSKHYEIVHKKMNEIMSALPPDLKDLNAPNEYDSNVCIVNGAVHPMTVNSMLEIYKLMVQYDILDPTSENHDLKCLELGCGVPYFAIFLRMIGCKVNAVDLSSGIILS